MSRKPHLVKPKDQYLKGRGAQINTPDPYAKFVYDDQPIDWSVEEDDRPDLRTQIIEVYPKTIINKVDSPDIPMDYSINPYQGCEHGCVYCYARNTHPYWGYSAGLDFEQKIMVKKNAAVLLEETFKKKSWKATPIMLSGNTDCYQPIERDLKITRSMLEMFWKYRHPVGIITKNHLILRDLDLLKQLNEHNLVHVVLSITTLNDELRQFLEPRTSSIPNRLRAVKELAENGIPVFVMMAPIIPGLNDTEIFDMVETVAGLGACSIGHTIVRLNGDVATLFEDWLQKNMPDRADRILQRIRDCHGGELKDSRFGARMKGEGKHAEIIHQQFRLAKKKFMDDRKGPEYNLALHEQYKSPQLRLF